MSTVLTLTLAAYALGSVSFAAIVARCHGINLRQHGSGNLGATNVGRVLGGRWFALVFIADCAKGLLPVLVMTWILSNQDSASHGPVWETTLVGCAAIIGHIWPLWHGFRGGKAVATSLGVIIALSPLVAGVAFVCWLLAWTIGTLSGLGKSGAVGPASVFATVAAVSVQWGWLGLSHLPTTILISIAGLMIIWRHRSNLGQLLSRRQQSPTAGNVTRQDDGQSLRQ